MRVRGRSDERTRHEQAHRCTRKGLLRAGTQWSFESGQREQRPHGSGWCSPFLTPAGTLQAKRAAPLGGSAAAAQEAGGGALHSKACPPLFGRGGRF